MSKWIKTDQPCPPSCGQSSDAFAFDKHGGGFCFSCNKPFKPEQLEEPPEEEEEVNDQVEQSSSERPDVYYIHEAHRGLSRKTVEFYDIPIAVKDGEKYS